VPIVVKHLEHTVQYQATYFDPVSGAESVAGIVQPDERGTWGVSPPPDVDHDWVLVLRQPPMSGAAHGTSNRAIAIHPENPKYFLFRGKPLALISATEHYGSVVNRAFDFRRYLRDAADKKQTMTRTFLLFREQQSSRNPSSPVKPESPDFVTPYVRSGPGTALDGEPLFDLDRPNPEYFTRLDDFLRLASELGVVVELTLLSNTYGDPVWALNPLNAQNNLQRIGKVHWADYTSLKDRALVGRQKAHVRKIVRATSSYDNVYYEICNEPGGGQPGHATPADVDAWQAEIAAVVRDELAKTRHEHLIFGSQAFTYTPIFRQPLDATFSGKAFDVVNVHPLPNTVLNGRDWMLGGFMSKELALDELARFCLTAQARSKPCVLDEDNTASLYRDETGWTIHRKRAWIALMSQLHYDYIDFSITAGNEAGTRASQRQLRTWFKNLSEFFHGLDFIHLAPIADWIEKKPSHVASAVLGRRGEQYFAYLADPREVTAPGAGQAIDGPVSLRLPAGGWHCELYSPTSGMHSPGVPLRSTGEPVIVHLTPFVHDVVLCVKRARELD